MRVLEYFCLSFLFIKESVGYWTPEIESVYLFGRPTRTERDSTRPSSRHFVTTLVLHVRGRADEGLLFPSLLWWVLLGTVRGMG